MRTPCVFRAAPEHRGEGTRAFGALCVMLCSVLASPDARADGTEGAAGDAQPGLHRVGFPEATRPTLAGTFGYGFTEAQSAADGAHHRLSLRLAGAASVLPWLNLAPVVSGRYDLHPDDS